MSHRIINIYIPAESANEMRELITKNRIVANWETSLHDGMKCFTVLVAIGDVQKILDHSQTLIKPLKNSKIVVQPVEALLPKETSPLPSNYKPSLSREELYHDVQSGTSLNRNFFLLVFFSTIVATIGLIENNIAVVIGAMVIAPLLGPILHWHLLLRWGTENC